MHDDFYLELNMEYFYRYIILNKKIYENDNINCYLKSDDEYGKTIRFDLDAIYGEIIIWKTGIIEEQIFNTKNHDLLFYLHYKIVGLFQCRKLFIDFYHALLAQDIMPPQKILLICSGGLTTSLFASKVQELAKIEKKNIVIEANGYHKIREIYPNYDYIYLAPQIAYLESKIMNITNNHPPVKCIDSYIYATQNHQALLDELVNLTKTVKE